MAGKGRKSLMGESLEGFTNSTKSIAELQAVADRLRSEGESVSAKEIADIANRRIKKGQYKTEPSVLGKAAKAILNSDIAKALAGKGNVTATSSMEAAQGQAEDAKKKITKQTKSNGGSITKNRIGGNDYRTGGYVLSTVDNRKKKS